MLDRNQYLFNVAVIFTTHHLYLQTIIVFSFCAISYIHNSLVIIQLGHGLFFLWPICFDFIDGAVPASVLRARFTDPSTQTAS